MKRPVLVGSLALVSLALGVAVSCHPKEPKQASAVDPVTEESSSGGGGSAGTPQTKNNSGGSDPLLAPPSGGSSAAPSGKGGKADKAEATTVSSLSEMMEGLRWGSSHAEVTKAFTDNGGVIWKDYDERLRKARVGPEMTAIEAEREGAKQAFGRSFIEFKDTPTGYDATGIKGEYTYRNRESLMWISRQGKKRYFFFINDRLWKVYDEVPLVDNGALGKTYLDAVNKTNATLGAQGRIQGADASKGINATTVDWKDSSTHLRLIDRSGEHVVAVVVEDSGTLGNLATLRPNRAEDPTAIDPSIAAVTKGGLSDPNAARAAASGSAAGKKPPPPKKK